MAAGVLADHFGQVTILERDHIDDHPSVHKSIPQGHQLHFLLPGGYEALSPFFLKTAEVISTPWALAAGADLAFPQTQGERSSDAAESAAYFAGFDRLCAEDPDALLLGAELFGLLKLISALFEEPLRSRVIAKMHAAPV